MYVSNSSYLSYGQYVYEYYAFGCLLFDQNLVGYTSVNEFCAI